ncbi:5-aminolevulinate synthase, nonspecific, mitochondrial [Apophysomyces sp. BC1034]|nr:5-aminolevulinate synthase, nonspecific, mitochondrial [Apophysomyces sp. BC1015]KAG0180644.1 5-aminolevulinate synthase, nonspecific, mitochondrial [Apophysomyces sp. BC1021]KAG0191039.1 5-aminolevulinate synthase, nonspecific, mitochondrial [Apophysomyces sp. BC1034]
MTVQMLPATLRSYYRDTYTTLAKAKVAEVGKDQDGTYLILDNTIFHPQGGGQPSDQGWIELDDQQAEVKKLVVSEGIVKHYCEGTFEIGQTVTQKVDKDKRQLHARWHSAGHLLSNAVNQLYPDLQGSNGHHFPGAGYVTFEGPIPQDLPTFKSEVGLLVNSLVQQALPTVNLWDQPSRQIQFGDLPAYPCGGTHVANTNEIGLITIRNTKKNQGKLRVGYNIE